MYKNGGKAVNGFESIGEQRYSHVEFDDGTCAIVDLDGEPESYLISDTTVADTEVEPQ